MSYLEKIKEDVAAAVNSIDSGFDLSADDIYYPPNPAMGDLACPLFSAAKRLGQNINETASLIAGRLSSLKIKGVSSVAIAGPYLNFRLDQTELVRKVIGAILDDRAEYGRNKDGAGQRVVVEYSNVNTHKEYHIGHIRNIAFGDAVKRILCANGYDAVPVSYINDFGIHAAKTLWRYMDKYQGQEPADSRGEFLGRIYAEASAELKDNDSARRLVELIMKNIESRTGSEFELWQKTRQWSIEQQAGIYRELGISFDHIYYESEQIERGRSLVKELKEQEVLKESNGALIADLSAEDLGVQVVLRSDGTALYPVADLALAEAKERDYHPDISIMVVDVRQSQYLKQLFCLLNKLGLKTVYWHLGFEFVKLPTGMMASRTGNIITYDQLKNGLMDRAMAEIGNRHADWTQDKKTAIAKKIAVGAMKFEMLKVGASQIITFDINKALAFEGHTSLYLQYTYARIKSIIRKSGNRNQETGIRKQESSLVEPKEKSLVLKMGKYPEIVRRAKDDFDPSVLAKYLFELAQEFNDYYHAVNILKAEDEVKEARLILIEAVSQVLVNGLKLLGIEVVEEL